MADVKISELTALTSPDGAEELVVNDGGTTKKIAIEDLFAGDNVKAKFGAGGDLEIYHDGSHSYIKDAGTGSLRLLIDDFNLRDTADSQNMMRAFNDGAVELYHDGSQKLNTTSTGIDVTGDVTGDGDVLLTQSGTPKVTLIDTTNNVTTQLSAGNTVGVVGTYSDHDFAIVTNSTTKVKIDSSGNVGIGVTPKTTWDGSHTVLQLGDRGALLDDLGGVTMMSNSYYDSGWKYLNTDLATMYESKGTHKFSVAPSGTADAAISWNTAMSIDNAGLMNINDHTASAYNQALSISSRCTERAGLFIDQLSSSYGNASYGVLRIDTFRANSNGFNYATFTADGDLGFKFRGDGNASADGSWSGSGADYAEYFEWSDGNSSNEDRRGYSVILEGNKIRQALVGETPMGVISGNPSVVGDAAWSKWDGKYLKDDFSTYILEEYTVTEWEAEETNDDGGTITVTKSFESDKIPAEETAPANATVISIDGTGSTLTRRTLNPDWNPDTEYVPREDRQEWDTVGLMGKLRIIKGQPVDSRWIKMRDVSDTVEEWLVR